MSARDDYAVRGGRYGTALVWEEMLDEIDRLRRRLDSSQGIGLREVKMPAPDDDLPILDVTGRRRVIVWRSEPPYVIVNNDVSAEEKDEDHDD